MNQYNQYKLSLICWPQFKSLFKSLFKSFGAIAILLFCGLLYSNPGFAADFGQILRAAQQGNAAAQLYVGYAYISGQGVGQDDAQGVFWYRKAAEQGNAEAQYNLAYMYKMARGLAKDEAQAFALYKMAADQGLAKAQYQVGGMYKEGRGVTKDLAQGFFWLRKSAEQGYADAQTLLGVMYRAGEGVAKDDTQAMFWHRKAADQGLAQGQYNVAGLYREGIGVAKDEAQAFAWYKMAAEQGHVDAQNQVGVMYRDARGVTKDLAQGVFWLRKAADQGLAVGQVNLAGCYLKGEGVARDEAQAMFWYRKAADQGFGGAQYFIAKTMIYGRGVEKNLDEAHYLLEKANAKILGDMQKCFKLSESEGKLPLLALALADSIQLTPRASRERAVFIYRCLGARGAQPSVIDSDYSRSAEFGGSALNYIKPGSNVNYLGSDKDSDPRFDREIELVLSVMDPSWDSVRIGRLLGRAGEKFAQCGIDIPIVRVEQGAQPARGRRESVIFASLTGKRTSNDPTLGEAHTESRFFVSSLSESELESQKTFVHELGHVLGLHHPTEFTKSVMSYDYQDFLGANDPWFTEQDCQQMRVSPVLLARSTKGNRIPSEPPVWSLDQKSFLANRSESNFLIGVFYTIKQNPSLSDLYLAQRFRASVEDVKKIRIIAHDWRAADGTISWGTQFNLDKPQSKFWQDEPQTLVINDKWIEFSLYYALNDESFASAFSEMVISGEKILQPLLRAAERGNRNAQTILAYKYRNGIGLPQDSTQADKWVRILDAAGAKSKEASKTKK